MKPFSIGVMSDSFRLTPREGIVKSAAVGADGIQIYAVAGAICPDKMDAEVRGSFRDFVAEQGLVIAALCGDLGGHGFQRAEENTAKIARSKAIVDLAADLGTRVVTTHIGVVPADRGCLTFKNMSQACKELGDYAAAQGITFAVETGPETAQDLDRFLDEVDSPGIGVNMDPANLVMVQRQDPVEAVRILGRRIVHTHAKDGINLQPCEAAAVYGAFADGGFGELVKQTGELFREMPLGEGSVPWPEYLAALEEAGFSGFLTIEREVGDNPEQDIAAAVGFLNSLLQD